MASHIVPPKTYAKTFGTLIGLTALTVGLGYADLGSLNAAIAIIIAGMKASLIALFFMHALYGSRMVRVAIAGGVFWVAVLISLTLADYFTRHFLPVPANQTPLPGL